MHRPVAIAAIALTALSLPSLRLAIASEESTTEPSGLVRLATVGVESASTSSPQARPAGERPAVQGLAGKGKGRGGGGKEGPVTFDLKGEDVGDHFGGSLATGDVDGDGVLDVAVGAFGVGLGRIYLFYGPVTKGLRAGRADVTVTATEPHRSLDPVAIGDLDGDGLDDLVASAFRADTNGSLAGEAYVFYGPVSGDLSPLDADATITGEEFDELGRQLATGDFNGDGLDDLAIASSVAGSGFAGRAWIFFGPVFGQLFTANADVELSGRFFSESFGVSIATGDVDGDGLDDLFVGAEQFPLATSGPGHAYVFLAPFSSGAISAIDADATLTGEEINDGFGSSVGFAGDVDGDGVEDLLVGAEESFNEGAGRAYVFHGPVVADRSAADADAKVIGEQSGDRLGSSVSGAGDLDGDGRDDFMVGAMFAAAERRGRIYLFPGTISGEVAAASAVEIFEGGAEDDRMGLTLLGPIDLDGSGAPDLLLGAPGFVGNGTRTRGFARGVLDLVP